LWADHIIIADQRSTDGSREIALNYPKVILVDNNSVIFNEPERQKLLISEARKIPGPRLLITLDADEIFTPNVFSSPEWKTVLDSKKGTIFQFQLANIRPDFQRMWLVSHFSWGFMDDGSEHVATSKIHTGRIPLPSSSNVVKLNQIKVIHFQYTAWKRMQSKHRWYQCYEVINIPGRSPLDIFRMYHHMYGLNREQLIPVPEDWISQYNKFGIDITSVYSEVLNYFDEQCLTLIEQYGANTFRKLYIWDVNWLEKAHFCERSSKVFRDPRSIWDRGIHKYLIKTQPRHSKVLFRLIDKVIKFIFNY
jgi:hypothetical protein